MFRKAAMLLAVLAIVLIGSTQAVLAQGPNEECPAGTVLIAKFEWNGSSYVYEKGLGASAITITNGTASGGNWTLNLNGYGVTNVIIKGGTSTDNVAYNPPATSGTFNNNNIVNKGGQIADISNIQFCGVEQAPTPTNTPVPPTNTPTNTPVPPTNTPTNTPVPPTNTPTNTPVPPTNTPTNTPVPPTNTPTNTPVPPTNTPTNTPVSPTNTPTNTPVSPTNTPTNTPVSPTNTPTKTPVPPTNTPTNTPVPPTNTPTNTPPPSDPGGNPTLKFDPDAQSLWYLETPTLHLEVRNNTGQGSITVDNMVCTHPTGVNILNVDSAGLFTSYNISGNTVTFSNLQVPDQAPKVLPAGQNFDVWYRVSIKDAPRQSTLSCTLNVQGFAPVVANFALEVRTPEQQQPSNGTAPSTGTASVSFQEGDTIYPGVSRWWDSQYLNVNVRNTGTTGISGFGMQCAIVGDDTGQVFFSQASTHGAFASVSSTATMLDFQNATTFTQGGNRNVTIVVSGLNKLRGGADADGRVSIECGLIGVANSGPDTIVIAPSFN